MVTRGLRVRVGEGPIKRMGGAREECYVAISVFGRPPGLPVVEVRVRVRGGRAAAVMGRWYSSRVRACTLSLQK